MQNFQIDGKNDKKALTFSFFMLEKSYLHQNGVELNFLFIGMASGHAISLRINPRIREDSKGVHKPDTPPHPTTRPTPDTPPTKTKSTKLDQIQYATLFQPQLEDSCTEQ